jgi:gliding motility-associated-like protein
VDHIDSPGIRIFSNFVPLMMMPKTMTMVRKVLTILGLLIGFSSFAQINCEIFTDDTIVCYKQEITLYTEFTDTVIYYWHHSGETQPNIKVVVKDTTEFFLTVKSKSDTNLRCTDSITIYTYPYRINVEFEQVNKGCPDECKAQVIGTASDGYPPFHYKWNADMAPNDSSLAVGLCSDETYTLRVTDTLCIYDTTYKVESFKLPEIEVTVIPDTIYRTNPSAEFSYENKSSDTISLTNWVWLFPDSTTTNEQVATYVFQDTASTVKLIYTTEDGCVDTIRTEVTIKEFKMVIPNVFTPNGDGANDSWEVPDLKKYISNEVVIFDRWGKKVYEANNYSNGWDGGRLGDGVYFYIMKCEGYWKEDVYRGSITIIGSRY